MNLTTLLKDIRSCTFCEKNLPLGPRPVITASLEAPIVIIGQAPGIKVHETGIPWNDASGKLLREWLGLNESLFYNEQKVALIPMGFCYPGKGRSGDMPPRPECAPQWHPPLWQFMKKVNLKILVGQYAQQYYLGDKARENLTQTVRHFNDYLPGYFPLPHPSPRNRPWLKKNPWFEAELVPVLKKKIAAFF